MERTYVTDTKELKKSMIDNGFDTITQLSNSSGVNRNTLGRIIDGTAQPSADVMYRLAKTLNMSPEKAGITFFALNLRST